MTPSPRPFSRPLFSRPLLAKVALAWCAVTLLQLMAYARAIAGHVYPDPDDALRLLQVRALIAGQGWFDMVQHRIDPLDGGVLMHWSRLVDLPIAGAILLLRPLLGMAGAELAAMVVVPLVTLACALLLVGRLASRMAPVRTVRGHAKAADGFDPVLLACLIFAMAVPVVTQIHPMRIDHHGWQIVAALGALNGLMSRSRGGGAVAGLAMALGLAISLEGLPLAMAFAAIGAWRWLVDGDDPRAAWLTHYLAALAVTATLVFGATRGLVDPAEHCDAVSPVHLAVFAFAAVGVTAIAFGRVTPLWRWIWLAAVGEGAIGIVLAMAPGCTRGTFTMLDPVVRALWLDQIAEGLPIWRQDAAMILQTLVPVLAGLWAAWRLALRGNRAMRRLWRDYALATLAALAVAAMVARAGGAACAFAAVPLALLVNHWLARARARGPALTKLAAVAGVVLVLAPALPLTLAAALPLGKIVPATRGVSSGALAVPSASKVSDCHIADNVAPLSALGPVNLLAPLDLGPELLLATPDTVLATSHHRGATAMRAVIDAFTAPEAQAYALVRHKAIAVVALCPGLAEPALYAHVAPHGLAAELLAGHPPAWLTPLPASGPMRYWRVAR